MLSLEVMKMNTSPNIPWQKIYDFAITCGSENDPKSFSISVLNNLKELCRFDQSLIYFLDGNRRVQNQYLMNIEKHWSTMYLEYYSKVENGRYALSKNPKENPNKPTINVIEWEKEPSTEFVPDYVRARGLKYSLGFCLYDINGMPRTVFALDKTNDEKFTEHELQTLSLLIPLINNLHKNYFHQQTTQKGMDQISWDTTNLTEREIDVVNLLCQGVSPVMISKALHISQSTTHKHISHIYQKMHVSNLQELLVRLLG